MERRTPDADELSTGMPTDRLKIEVNVRRDGPFWIGSAKMEDHCFVTNRMTSKVGARLAALGFAMAHIATEALETEKAAMRARGPKR